MKTKPNPKSWHPSLSKTFYRVMIEGGQNLETFSLWGAQKRQVELRREGVESVILKFTAEVLK